MAIKRHNDGGRLVVTYQTFGIVDGDDWPLDDPGQGNGLVHPCGHGALVYAGIHTGPVEVQAVSREQPHDRIDDSRPWQEVAEVSVTAPTGYLRIRSFEDVVPLPTLGAAGPGTYRVRVYADGRDTDIDGAVRAPVKHYRIEVWPAPCADDVIHRRTAAGAGGSPLARKHASI
ncbi:hypothetical protein ACLQ2S_22995 [Micromonospora sp. DT48]|uniref:hypothetical protein n=1 Tax=Micromonospora sp. DT48 TaxID=3393429 RepID=UPI003CEA6DC8